MLQKWSKKRIKMDWQTVYQQKLTAASEAVKAIKSNDQLVFGHAAGAPVEIEKALVANKDSYSNVRIFHMVSLGPGEYAKPEMEGHFIHNTTFVGGNTRKAVEENRGEFIPCFFYQVPELFKSGEVPVDVAVIHVSRPNAEGYCSFGVSCDYTKPAAEMAKIVIAEANDKMPFVGGDNLIHVSKIDYIVETSNPIFELPSPRIGEVELAIGRHCANLVEDGSTLQLGIGGIPDAVLMSLKDKKDLGIHTEMFSDCAVELIEMGVINGSKKSIHQGQHVSTFLMGGKKLYDFVNNNDKVKLFPVDYVNHPTVVMQNHKMVSINSCIEVDLMGQVVSEAIGLKQFSGVGGQVDYVRGASMAVDGKSIMAMPSTTAKGTVSKIVPFIAEGAAVTTSRNDVDYVVTEFGAAKLKGKTLKERALSLIAIAHPDFRDSLMVEFNKRFGRK